jgi:hypothetical protein
VQYCLGPCAEFVVEGLGWYNRALVDESATVGVIGAMLEETMPMLQEYASLYRIT